MRDAIRPDRARAVHAEDDRKVRDADIVHHLVDRTLEERRVDCDDGTPPARRKSRRERDHVPFGDADVEKPIRKDLRELGKSRPVLHARRQRHDPLVLQRRLANRLAEAIRPGQIPHVLGCSDAPMFR